MHSQTVTFGGMESLPTGCGALDLCAVRVRPTRGAQEHRRWDRLVANHHYLSFQGLFGQQWHSVQRKSAGVFFAACMSLILNQM